MKLTPEQIDEYVTAYETTNKLPVNKVPCTVTGVEVTMFGSNLHKRVAKYGGIRQLLTGFISRAGKPKPAKAPKAPKVPKAKAEKAPKKVSKKAKAEKLLEVGVPKAKYAPRKRTKAERQSDSKGGCARPDAYLDGGKSCELCPETGECLCGLNK